jgi:hypothetical protein
METIMHKVVMCSICSREKDNREIPLPARIRYAGTHVASVEYQAKREQLPLYILSGLHGFISGDEEILNYDYLLTTKKVPELVQKLIPQLAALGVGEIRFYTKRKPNWEPYLLAIQQAADPLGIRLLVRNLAEND